MKSIQHFFLFAILVIIMGFSGGISDSTRETPDLNTVITPTEPIELFNGKNLTEFYTWLVDYKFEDSDNVFSVVDQIDGAPAIRISGQHWGGLITKQSYSNYHLIAEFRWGTATWGSRKDRTRDSGILLHAQGTEGNSQEDFNGPWMRSIEYQIIEGGTGDFILVGGYTEDGKHISTQLTATVGQDYNGQYVWDDDGEERAFEEGRINWYGRDPEWKDELGFRGLQDVEKPVGEWNRIEVIADGETLTYLLNGEVVNKGFNSSLTEGKLLFQSEGAELFIRRIELRPLSY